MRMTRVALWAVFYLSMAAVSATAAHAHRPIWVLLIDRAGHQVISDSYSSQAAAVAAALQIKSADVWVVVSPSRLHEGEGR